MKVTCSKPFLLCAALLLVLDDRGFYLLVFGGILIHEAGHLLAISLLRCHVETLELRLSGLRLDYTEGHLGYGRDALIALGGPLANLIAAGILMAVCRFQTGEAIYLSIGIQVLLAGFNLLPALPMDGGRALRALVSCHCGLDRGEQVLQITTALVSAMMMGVGLYACKAPWHNPTLLMTAFLLLAGLLKQKNNSLQMPQKQV